MKRSTRPSLSAPLRALIRDIARRLPELAHVRASRILVVAGEARRASHATIRPLRFPRTHTRIRADGRREKPLIRVRGRSILYVITLRPIWFRASTPEQRVATVIHELFHMSTRFDGTLHAGRRHARLGATFGRRLAPLVRRYLAECPPAILAPLAYTGVVRIPQWLERPPSSYPRPHHGRTLRRSYTEEQLFNGIFQMITEITWRAGGLRLRRAAIPASGRGRTAWE